MKLSLGVSWWRLGLVIGDFLRGGKESKREREREGGGERLLNTADLVKFWPSVTI